MGSVDAPVGGLPHEEEDFGKTLLDMLGSPRAHFSNGLNGLNTLFSPEINSSSNFGAYWTVAGGFHGALRFLVGQVRSAPFAAHTARHGCCCPPNCNPGMLISPY
jgi:hypothetical protein